MLVQFDPNNIINVDRIDSIYKTGDNALLVFQAGNQIRLRMSLKEFENKITQHRKELAGTGLLTEVSR